MANLINCYHYVNPENLHNFNCKNIIPGDLIFKVIEDFNEFDELTFDFIEFIWIVDLKKNMHKIGKCYICEYFHLRENHLRIFLGRHWEKYKKRYDELGCEFNYQSSEYCF